MTDLTAYILQETDELDRARLLQLDLEALDRERRAWEERKEADPHTAIATKPAQAV